jgi:uncharacterized protein (DUF433 family)
MIDDKVFGDDSPLNGIYEMSSPDNITNSLNVINPRVVKTSGICGGDARIAGTRMSIWCLVASRNAGCSDERLLGLYPHLQQDDLEAAWQYFESNQEEIKHLVDENMSV